jgi:hypothetical protein
LLNPLIHSRFLRAGVLQGTLACAGRIPPVARMRLLPGSDTRRIFSIPEVIFIARLLQPRPLTGALAGLLTLRLRTKALASAAPVVGKKKFLAVQAITAALFRLHSVPNKGNHHRTKSPPSRKKIQTEEKSAKKKEEKISANPSKKNHPKKIHFLTAAFGPLPSRR